MPLKDNRARKKVDATIDLAVQDPAVARDWKTLRFLGNTVRSKIAKPGGRQALKKQPSLYTRYRGTGFPLLEADGGKLLPWNKLSQWMKTQIASLCLQSTSSVVFTITLHEELADELRERNVDLKAYLRDRLGRCLRREFPQIPWFQFVIEDRSRTGKTKVKLHAHGAIQILPIEPRLLKGGGYSLRTRTKIAQSGLDAARLMAGREAVERAIKLASGNDGERGHEYRGRSQARNIWMEKPYHSLFNTEWMSYSLKNALADSQALPDNRLAMSRPLNQEAQRLWALIRDGEAAIDLWPK